MIYKQRIIAFILLTVISNIAFAQNKKGKIEEVDVIKKLENLGLSVDQKVETIADWYKKLEKDSKIKNDSFANVIRFKQDTIDDLIKKNNSLNNNIDDLKKKVPLSDLEYRAVGKIKWAAKNLDSQQVVEVIKDIKFANSKTEWDENFRLGTPSFCYHINDSLKQYGVLLNKFALLKLRNSLEQTSWRFPSPLDFDSTNNIISQTKCTSVLSALTTGKGAKKPNWRTPGVDLFDLNIAPLSYRRNTSKEWFGGDAASFYCYDQNGDTKLEKILLIAEISETEKSIMVYEKELIDEYNNFGLFVRLIRKTNF